MRIRSLSVALLITLICTILAACGSAGTAEPVDEVATIVAATLAAEGGAAPAATDAPAPSAEPSPTATEAAYGNCDNAGVFTVVYLKDDNVWLWTQGGANMALTASNDVQTLRISDDGCRVAYARRVPNPNYDPSGEILAGETLNELWVVNSDGSNAHLLAGMDFFGTLPAPEDVSIGLYDYAWLPGTHTVGFSTQAVSYGLALSEDLHLADADSAAISTLLAAGNGGNFAFSPDGNQVAFATTDSINVVNVDGSNPRLDLVVYAPVVTYSEYQYYAQPAWGQDSNQLMVAIPPAEGLGGPVDGVYPETDLWYIPLDGTAPWIAGSVQNVWFAQSAVRFAPDISRIAYLRPVGLPEENRFELVAALSDGSNESAAIEENRITIGAWGPASGQLLYWYQDLADEPVIQLLNAADGSITPRDTLTQFQANTANFWWPLPDTYVQALYRGADGFIELSLMHLDGTGVVIDAYQGQPNQIDVAP